MCDDDLQRVQFNLQRQRINAQTYRPDSIPSYYQTYEGWEDRGYKPRDGENPSAYVLSYSGNYLEARFSLSQCRKIRGGKAAKRRDRYHAASGQPESEDLLTGQEPYLSSREGEGKKQRD